jgi:hypothetical protein
MCDVRGVSLIPSQEDRIVKPVKDGLSDFILTFVTVLFRMQSNPKTIFLRR